jgi:hypothetical protein
LFYAYWYFINYWNQTRFIFHYKLLMYDLNIYFLAMPPKADTISQVELEARLEELWIRTRRCPLPPPPDPRTFPDQTPEEQLEDLWVRVRGCPIPEPIPLEYPTVATEQEAVA